MRNFARCFAARETREEISGFAAKSFARATTPASYAGYGLYITSNVLHST